MSKYTILEGEAKVNELIVSYKSAWKEVDILIRQLTDTPSKVPCGLFGLFERENKERDRLWRLRREKEKVCDKIGHEIVDVILDTEYGGHLFDEFVSNRSELSVYSFYDGFEVCRPPDEYRCEDDEVTLMDFKLDKPIREQILECAEERVKSYECDIDRAKRNLAVAERGLKDAKETLDKIKQSINNGETA